MDKSKIIFIDIETTSLNFMKGEIKLIAFTNKDNKVITRTIVDEEIEETLKDKGILKVFHNAKFDVEFFIHNGYEVNNYSCTLVMAQVLGEKELSLKALCNKHLGVVIDKSLQHSENWKTTELTKEHIHYATQDVTNTQLLYYELLNKITEKNLLETYERERRALPSIVMLELNGIKMDFEQWNRVLDSDRELCYEIEKDIKEILNSDELNLNSPKQLVEALYTYGIKLHSTSDDELAKHSESHAVVKLIRKYRKLKTKIKTYGDKLIPFIQEDERIRGSWWLIGASSGRMSCNNPPLQAMPGSSREFFVAEENYKLVCADYSQIELRVLASISKDEKLIKFFKKEIDLHIGTASSVFNKSVEEVTKEERQIAKSLNFGIIYGITAYGIQKNLRKSGLDVSLEEAEEYRLEFLRVYPKVRELQDNLLKADYIRTLGGRRWKGSTLSMTQRLNFPIQGSAAEGLKEALALLVDNMKPTWKLVTVVHDEIVLEVREEEVEEAKEVLENSMKVGMRGIIKDVPIVVEALVSDKWVK